MYIITIPVYDCHGHFNRFYRKHTCGVQLKLYTSEITIAIHCKMLAGYTLN